MMRSSIFYILVFATLIFSTANSSAQSYKIDVEIEGWQDTTLILGHYFNNSMLVNDTIIIDNNGKGTFTGEEALPGGIYIIYMPDKSYFDILIDDEQHFSLKANNKDPLNNMIIKGNTQGKVLNNYQKFLAARQKTAGEIQNKLKESTDDKSDSVEIWKTELSTLSKEVNSYWEKIYENHKGTFLAKFLLALHEVEVPDFKTNENLPDSVIRWNQYSYYKNHYFDNIDMTDERLLRTPFFTRKLESFFTKTVFQIPDSIVKESVRVIDMAKSNPDMKKYLIQYTFNLANESKVMGMDAAMVSLAEKYYLSGEADWVDEEFLTKLKDRVTKLKPNLIGKNAPDLKLSSPENQYFRLSEVYSPLTILVFWEPECGHCKKEIPKLKEEVWDKYQDLGIKIFAVFTQHEKEQWTDFIAEHQLEEWINVYDPYNQSNFRNLYDIYSTPAIFVLDKNKKIIAKRIGVEQLPGFIDHQLKLNSENSK